jgi:hypothetical protein
MPTDSNVLRPLQRNNNPTVRGRAITVPVPKMGPVTQSFFARGEEQEATGYENLAADDPVLQPPELEFDSFDKIPRKRGSWFALGISLMVLLAVGFVTWRSFHFLSKPGSSVAAASRAMVQSPPLSQSPPAPAATPAPAMSGEPAGAPAPAGSAVPAAPAAPAAPAPAAAPVMSSVPNTPPAPPAPSAATAEPAAPPATHAIAPPIVVPLPPRQAPARAKREPLRGYVWSPEKHTIVPAEPAIQDPAPTEAPHTQTLEGTPAEEPEPAREPTNPAPFQPTPTPAPPPQTSAPIIE